MPGEPLPLFPLNTVLFPRMHLPLHIFEERYRLMIARCLEANAPFGVVLIRSGQEVGEPAEPHPYGTTARIVQAQRLPDGRYRLLCRGEQRFRIERVVETRPYIVGEVVFLEDEAGAVTTELLDETRSLWKEYVELLLKVQRRETDEPPEPFQLAEDLGARDLSYLIAANLQVDRLAQQRLLEAGTAAERLMAERQTLRRELPILRLLSRDDLPTADASGRFSIN